VSVALAMLVSPTILAQETATATRNTTNESGETAGMGAQLTAFTQSSSIAVNESVENGMWKAGFNRSNASDRARLVSERSGVLERRLERLQRQNESVRERYENGSLPQPAYIAQQSRLSARIDALRTAINDTGEAAAQAGVNDSRLEGLRQNAANLTGPEVATIARGLGGGPPEDRGPPETRGVRAPPAEASDRGQSANRTRGGDGAGERGQSANRTRGVDGAGERGQSANRIQGGDAVADGGGNATDSGRSGNAANGTGAADDTGGGQGAADDGAGSQGAADDTAGSQGAADDTGGSRGAADDTAGGQDGTSDRGSGTDRGPPDDAPGRSRN